MGITARVVRGRTYCLMVVAVVIACLFMTDAFAHRAVRRPAHRHATLAKPSRHHHAVRHHRPRARHRATKSAKAAKRHAAHIRHAHRARQPRQRIEHRRLVVRHRTAGPRLLASCGYSPRAVRALHSRSVYVLDVGTGKVLAARNAHTVRPIASVSKLMTSIVARRARRPLGGILRVTANDLDMIKFTHSRLAIGSKLSRRDMYHIALMSSENRAASALSRDYPGGRPAFVAAMNREARRLRMRHTHFRDPTGLSPHNVSTAEDLSHLVAAAARDPLIRRFSTDKSGSVYPGDGELRYVNSDPLVRFSALPIVLQKTGFINEAGHCVVIRMRVHGRPETVVLLGSPTRRGTVLDALEIHRWLDCSLT